LGETGHFNNFFDLWDDENATIDHFDNQGISLNNNANWTGSFVFSAGNQSMQVAPVISLRDSTITANYSNGVTDYNSNGLYIENTVIQATGLWQVYSANSTGNYQGAYLKNIYSESSTALNPLSRPRSPFPGLGIAGLIAGISSGAASFQIEGNGGPLGAFATGGDWLHALLILHRGQRHECGDAKFSHASSQLGLNRQRLNTGPLAAGGKRN
jgi:hypothetical protein